WGGRTPRSTSSIGRSSPAPTSCRTSRSSRSSCRSRATRASAISPSGWGCVNAAIVSAPRTQAFRGASMDGYVEKVLADVKAKNPAEPEFHQAVQEVAESVSLVVGKHPEYRHAKIFERIIEPERV